MSMPIGPAWSILHLGLKFPLVAVAAAGTFLYVTAEEPQPMVAITFDDGYQSVLDIAVPAMARREMVGTHYITLNQLGAGDRVSGDISAAFIYGTELSSEIDVEFEGQNNSTHLLTWSNGRRRDWTNLDLGPVHGQFHIYKFVWEPGLVTFYRDDVEIAQHRNRVPSNPAPMFFNHWGTHNNWWGGIATPDTVRYMYVDWFRYTPLN